MWQRLLFAAYGMNIESVTIVVSVFMLGLGIGALIGGFLSQVYSSSLLMVFVVSEVAIGLFGLVSLPLIRLATNATVEGSLLTISVTTYALLCLPTIFMGATLPVLVAQVNQRYQHVGMSVGFLYFFNTIGSAVSALLTVEVLFPNLGLQGTILVASCLNFVVAIGAVLYSRGRGVRVSPGSGVESTPEARPATPRHMISYPLAMFLAGASGYISLSQEILWMRAVGYASGGLSNVFGHVLGCFLLGIAGGALAGKEACRRDCMRPQLFTAAVFLTSAVLYFVSIPLSSLAVAAAWELGLLTFYLMITLVAFLLGSLLPVISHYGIPVGSPVGVSLARIYMANIIGSAAGPLVTGFVLLNLLTLEQSVAVLSLLSLMIGSSVWLLSSRAPRPRIAALAAFAGLAALMVVAHHPLYRRVLERLHFSKRELGTNDYRYVLQNRSGIIAVSRNRSGDILYGGGATDGSYSVDPLENAKGIRRAYMLAALHPRPTDILEIGMGSGSWTWVMAANDLVQKLTVVEINPGYLELAARYSPQRSILSDPKVRLELDDGRRWLRRHPTAKFDVIVLMTIYHWRSNATNMLSREFLELCKAHLKPGGVVYLHPTRSEDVQFTAASVFRYVAIYDGMVAASDRPFALSHNERRRNIGHFRSQGRPLLQQAGEATQAMIDDMATLSAG